MKIEEIDSNFKIEKINKPDIKFYNPEENPFKIYGIERFGNSFIRIPDDVAKATSENVHWLNHNVAGGRIRFKTDSPYIALLIDYYGVCRLDQFALTGSTSADVYVTYNGKQMYLSTFRLPFDIDNNLESVIDCDFDGQMMEYTLNLPLYSGMHSIFIGLSKNAKIEEAEPYNNELPVVYYGSSITQGGCASRPGNCYQAILSRKYNIDYFNLGYSGSALAEDAIIDYIAKLPMSLFVMDYDYNTPNAEHLRETHEKAFKKIRDTQHSLPILILAAPKYDKKTYPYKEFEEREQIVEQTYLNAIKNGDRNVYYIDGHTLMEECGYDGTVDFSHPNDYGFYSMAKAISNVFDKFFK